MSDRNRWRRVEQICQTVLDLPVGDRDEFLRDACGDDADIRDEIRLLLAKDPAVDSFLITPLAAVAAHVMPPTRASLTGRRLGVLAIGPCVGRGGMGEVYRARDTRLERDVALKVLPDAFALDPDRLGRFRREAQILASLNHPNIAAIYGVEECEDVYAIVLELVDGPTLAERLARGAIPMAEALTIARQVAEGIEAAHERGVVHRDLKPANIKLRPDGAVKVLDFGIARALDAHADSEEIGSSPASPGNVTNTKVGSLLGTADYMSPEQRKGCRADKRSDIWAFGAVLFEMLTGQHVKVGETSEGAVALPAVDGAALPPATPAAVRRLIARCLEPDARRRLRDIGEARIVLEDPLATSSDEARLTTGPATRMHPWRRVIAVAIAAAAFTAAALAGWYLKPSPVLAVTRFAITLPEARDELSVRGPSRASIALSRDGAQLVYASNERLYLRAMSESVAQPIRGSESHQAVLAPAFSPDGRFVVFWALSDRTLKRIAIAGGAAETICAAENPVGVEWTSDHILFGQLGKGIMRVAPDGGAPTLIAATTDGEQADSPQLLPGGRHVLFTLATGTARDRWDHARIVAQSLATGQRKTLVIGGSAGRYVATGHLVYAVGGTLFARAFDAARLEMKGTAIPVVVGVGRSVGGATGVAQFSVSEEGTLAYVVGPASPTYSAGHLALVDRQGQVDYLNLPPGLYESPRASPDGSRIAFGTDDGKEAIVWTFELAGGRAMQRLTSGGSNRFPIWTSDSKRIVFQSDRDGDRALFWQRADGAAAAERLTTPDKGEAHVPESWSPNSDVLLFSVASNAGFAVRILSLGRKTVTSYGAVQSVDPPGAVFSPDGRWVAYTSSAKRGKTTVHVQPFPATGAKFTLTARGFDTPHAVTWSADGKELFYDPRPGGFESVSVTTNPSFAFGDPVTTSRSFLSSPPEARRRYDVTPSGQFLVVTSTGLPGSGGPPTPQVQVVLNWFQELRQRMLMGR
ncbi:Serine/threonine-protein kinase PrkC [Luteitalea pratensis]|uniref:Serine/threonine-protein kinase PrkC n=1 Tax=Luteitalea pratensis TaxID=1855912 RepID=A0A143PLR3_LUTPR|nr:protein kinase [Luteitalea pratensis]AMY09517.1 Serine/threonine-protein kinase PrkC [Luteitalea pratensis]